MTMAQALKGVDQGRSSQAGNSVRRVRETESKILVFAWLKPVVVMEGIFELDFCCGGDNVEIDRLGLAVVARASQELPISA